MTYLPQKLAVQIKDVKTSKGTEINQDKIFVRYESAKCQDSPHKAWTSDFPSGGEIILDWCAKLVF